MDTLKPLHHRHFQEPPHINCDEETERREEQGWDDLVALILKPEKVSIIGKMFTADYYDSFVFHLLVVGDVVTISGLPSGLDAGLFAASD